MKHLRAFLTHLEHVRGMSIHTVAAAARDLTALAAEHGGVAADPATLATPQLKSHIVGLVGRGLARSSVARHASSIRTFFRWLLDAGHIEVDPSRSLKVPRPRRSLPKALSSEDLLRLLSAAGGDDFTCTRDRAVLEVLYSSGVRVSEMAGLSREDLDMRSGRMRVLGKGRRERQAFLGRHALKALADWWPLRTGVAKGKDRDRVFLNRFGTPLTDRSIRRVLARRIRGAGLPSGITPHTLRHTFATHLLTAGAGLKEVQEMLGHRHLSSTQIYTHVTPGHLKKVHERAHPRGKVSPRTPVGA